MLYKKRGYTSVMSHSPIPLRTGARSCRYIAIRWVLVRFSECHSIVSCPLTLRNQLIAVALDRETGVVLEVHAGEVDVKDARVVLSCAQGDVRYHLDKAECHDGCTLFRARQLLTCSYIIYEGRDRAW